jgi:hypothetical protein
MVEYAGIFAEPMQGAEVMLQSVEEIATMGPAARVVQNQKITPGHVGVENVLVVTDAKQASSAKLSPGWNR